MDIVFFTNRMTKGGSERVISYLANDLSKDHDVTILTMTSAVSDYFLEDNVKHSPLENKKAGNNHSVLVNISRVLMLRKYIKKHPNAIYISFVTLPSYILLLFRRLVKGPIIVTVRNDPEQQHKTVLDKYLVKLLYPKADAMVFQTREQAQFYKNITIKKQAVLPNPVNEQFIKKPYDGIRDKEIVTVGRLIKQKNQELLIKTFAKMSSDYPEYVLKIYGEGYLREFLEKLIKELQMEDRIFLQGSVSDLQSRIYKASAFVLSSDFEGIPNALLEAMALGLPVVSTNCSGGVQSSLSKMVSMAY